MARNILGPVLLGHKIVQQAFVAGVRTGWVPVIGTGQRILENGSGSPRRAIPISIAPLFDEVELVAQNFQHVSLIVGHNCPPRKLRPFDSLPMLAMILVELGTGKL
jgi:hypothetical protein